MTTQIDKYNQIVNKDQQVQMLLKALKMLLVQFEINLPKSGIVHDEQMALMHAYEAIREVEGK